MKNKLVSIIIPTRNKSNKTIRCIESIFKNKYKNVEIIVVDNNSEDNTVDNIKKKYANNKKLKLIEKKINFGASEGRNKGARKAKGEYLLFLDSDNVIHNKMIQYLVDFLEKRSDCGMVGPLMLFKENKRKIWLYFADLNHFTSQAFYKGTNEIDKKQYDEVIRVGHLPNCFMVYKKDFRKVNGFDEKYFIMYEEADFAEKIKKLNKKIYIYSKAITYHDVPLNRKIKLGLKSKERAYLTARNRVYYMKKNASLPQLILFFLIFNPLIFLYYELNLLINGEFKKAEAYLKGTIRGFFI